MAIDASIYQGLRPVQMPSMLDSQAKAANLSSIAMQQARGAKQMGREDEEYARTQHLQKASAFGNALDSISGLSSEQRAAAWPKVRQELVQGGIVKPDEYPEQYDEGLYRQNLMRFQQSKEGIDKQLKMAQIGKLNREAGAAGLEEYQTNYGVARTKDDAKQLKAAGEMKSNFDRKLNEMISLREKYGAETMNREAVARGKQLSKDLLLAYKDLSKLGVLSQADEKILNAIIPEDPLEFNTSSLIGQDPTMHRLEKFKEDANADFQSKLANRIRGGQAQSDQMYAGQRGGDRVEGFGPSAHAKEPPKNGAVEDGYVFMGGNPSDPKSWKKVR